MNDASLEQLMIANGFWSASAKSTVSLQICMMCLAFSIVQFSQLPLLNSLLVCAKLFAHLPHMHRAVMATCLCRICEERS